MLKNSNGKIGLGKILKKELKTFSLQNKDYKDNRAETDSLYNKKTFASTDMDMTSYDFIEMDKKDPIPNYVNIIIENPVLNNVYFQMAIFYNFFYAFLHFFLLFTILI